MTPSRSQRARKPGTVLRKLAAFGMELCTCPALTHTDRVICRQSDFDELLTELRRALNKEKR